MIQAEIQAKNSKTQKNKKGPRSHRKIKCSFLDYIQLLMIGRAIQAINVDQNTKKQKSAPEVIWKINICFWITFSWMIGQVIWVMNWLKCKKRPPKSSKMKCSFSDGLPEDQQKTYQKTVRRPPEDCQKTTRRPLAVFWQSSNTMIQGNFCKRLHFYMDSCAISPMASLFVEYTEKKTSVFQIQLEFWVNMTLCFWLNVVSPWKSCRFCPSCNFSNLFPPKWLRMTQNGQFHLTRNFSNLFHWSGSEWLATANFARFTTFPIFSHRSGSEWLGMANFTRFATFPIFSHWSTSEWLGMANFTWFTTFPIFSHQSGS